MGHHHPQGNGVCHGKFVKVSLIAGDQAAIGIVWK